MYKTFIYIIFGCFILHGCISNKSSISSKKENLPSFIACDSIITILDSGTEFNRLENLDDLSYSYTYNLVFIPGDSLSKEVVRNDNSNLAASIVKKIFPKVHVVSDSILKRMDYSEIMNNTSRLVQIDYQSEDLKKHIEGLIASNKSRKQLFIEARYYLVNSQIKNNVSFFVFDVVNKRLLYYDKIIYSCDFRDEAAYYQVLKYGLEKLKKNS